MSLELIKHRLATYSAKTPLEEENALKEITQEIILLGLSRKKFFSVAEFHGGTALRILYGLPRFSEDLDFALLKPNPQFSLAPYLDGLADELAAFGFNFEIVDRTKADNTIKKAFLKEASIGKLLLIKRASLPRKIKIKLEVDANPPEGTNTELKYLDFPIPFGIITKDLPSSFSGKLHALLCQNYLKGRDWYDFIWYVARNTSVNLSLLESALKQNGPWAGKEFNLDQKWLTEALIEKIQTIHWPNARQDVAAFIRAEEQESLQIWSESFFMTQVEKMNPD